MENKMKKLLSIFSAAVLVSSASSAVAACGVAGFNFDTIRNRKINTKEYISTYSSPPAVWSPIASSTASDSEYWGNLFATVLSVDEYGRTYGDLVESGYASASASSGGKSIYVGNDSTSSSLDLTKWKYKLRDDAYWYSADGTRVRKIKASDFLLSAKYALTPSNTVSTSFLWTDFIKGATEAYYYLNKFPGSTMEEVIKGIKEDWVYRDARAAEGDVPAVSEIKFKGVEFGIVIDDSTGSIEFNLLKPAPYFESLLTYNAFSPTPAENYAEGQSGKVEDPKDTLFSGAYLPVGDLLSGSKMEFVKNPQYYFADKAEIEKIIFKKISKSSADLGRTLFETGETIAYGINPTDAVGWDRYVGSDLDNPKIDEVSVGQALSTQTFVLSYNMNYNNGAVTDQKLIDGSRLLQSKAARALLSTGYNRNVFGKYYSAKYDKSEDTSLNVRNTFTPSGFAEVEGKDYTSFIEEEVKTNIVNSTHKEEFKIADGNEVFLDHADWYTDWGSRASLVADVQKFIDENKLTKNEKGKVELSLIGSDQSTSVLGPYTTRTIGQFNAIENNPIEIKYNILPDSQYMDAYRNGGYHLFEIAWIPDFNDPATFLGTLKIDGGLSGFTGLSTSVSSNAPLLLDRSSGAVEGLGSDKLSHEINDKFKTTASDEVVAFAEDYTDKFDTIDGATTFDQEERYKNFAEIEANALYSDFLVLPNYNPAPPRSYSISYLRPYTYAYSTYGASSSKYFTYRLNEQLWTKEQVKQWRELYRAEKNKVATDPSYRKSGNIFYED